MYMMFVSGAPASEAVHISFASRSQMLLSLLSAFTKKINAKALHWLPIRDGS
jgi:hypothetical protein